MGDRSMSIRIATSQFPTSGDPAANAAHMTAQIWEAARGGAHLVHFAESALSGYAGHDLESHEGYDWEQLSRATERVVASAREHGVWTVFGSAHPLTEGRKPHNCVYIVDDRGRLIDRYDKRFCAGASESEGELAHYTPGDHSCVWEIGGVRFGALICHEYRYPELYRDYARQGVQVMLHSFHSGNIREENFRQMEEGVGRENHALNPATTIAGITQLAAMHSRAAENYVWISCANSSAPRSCWPAFMVRPDGVAVGRLELERAGLLFTDIVPDQQFYDSTRAWRERAMNGRFHSGSLVNDPRSRERTSF